ncbi:MAG: tRNA (guanosine(37)-N1)-methyltransferase TrmD [Candidatus Lindowbacteria bacterium RIFCSPLOWO2_12_FULL_62_27]|nr:MAG: tRNA (guanosine(37)-N1)-methyltransferase TrmD [Candidatus Lindowbacteria bacterium RIFCSPLOWO2_02_FULL_62_12]OGH62582.1 MAG: tRNA (guanosine(37)-N1)-methyltransferase TrmD [Candidatus Lindowbacteria bacterium RIFCSPLOWO2_12_FULL_62_27]
MDWIVLTLFPDMFRGAVLAQSVLGNAVADGRISVTPVNIRDYAEGPHRVCDDTPYGGGPGMVMKPEPIVRAFRDCAAGTEVVLALSASGELFDDRMAQELSARRRISASGAPSAGVSDAGRICLLCGRYEGIDQRALEVIGAREISVGSFVLSGGEIAALAVIDAVSRYVPGVLGKEASRAEESFAMPGGLLEYPQYTRPAAFETRGIPETLRSGDHAAIFKWRAREAILRTARRRPDLLEEKKILASPYGSIYLELKKEGAFNGQSNRPA